MQRVTCYLVLVPRKPLVTSSCVVLTWVKAGYMARRGPTYCFTWVWQYIYIVPIITMLTDIQWWQSSLETSGSGSPDVQGPLRQLSRKKLENEGTTRFDRRRQVRKFPVRS